jgi:hypothetical protein
MTDDAFPDTPTPEPTNVVRLDREQIIWRCVCGCTSFVALASGDLECCNCRIHPSGPDGSWRSPLPDVPDNPPSLEGDDITVASLHTSDAALRRNLGKATTTETAFVIIAQRTGAVSTWGEALEGEEQLAWFDRRMAVAKGMLSK